MIDYYKSGNSDLYAYIASVAMHKDISDCMEFYPKGTKVYFDGKQYHKATGNEQNIEESTGADPYTNKEGKTLRKNFKAILLGICYGKGVGSVAEDLGITEEAAQELFDTFFNKFPKIKEFMDISQNMARKYGYVETVMGRRRRIPAMTLPEYDFESVGNKPVDFNPLDFMSSNTNLGVSEEEKERYRQLLKKARYYKEKQKIKEDLELNGIKLIDNTKKISDATRQCLNSRVQGSAGDQAKLAMIEAFNNERLKELGFHMLIPVHDEVVCECPIENVEECSKIFSNIMSHVFDKYLPTPFKCDVSIFKSWNG